MAPPTFLAPALPYCDESDIQDVLSTIGETGRLDDNDDGTIDPTEQGRVQKAIFYATARVNFYCASRYATADLATCWTINNYATVLACVWLSRRRGNPPPAGLLDLEEEVLTDLKEIRSGDAQLPEIGLRTAAWPAWSNVRIDSLYSLRKVRVQTGVGMSEQTPTPYRRNVDWPSVYVVEP
jgi:hypothetical protein